MEFVYKKDCINVYSEVTNGFGSKQMRKVGKIFYCEAIEKFLYDQNMFGSYSEDILEPVVETLKKLNKDLNDFKKSKK